ncbi:hypothetical protein JNUCC1_01676 [Lentibacillus sp. JNUCC-1]|uniref:hypothetical protein n=1 Tax=Lentibacillus sp. JNUCC-1 TaxID=2654513 RepID=UPI0012E88896|nr:hypothetical protein [Lentibacillus sp. JNUCC-1]MUV37870.1 hypothetical protein [Lentibacillus sp. JNUCC-1]
MEPFLALVLATIVIVLLSLMAHTLKKKLLFPVGAVVLSVVLYVVGYVNDGWTGLGFAVASVILIGAAVAAAGIILMWWLIVKEYKK